MMLREALVAEQKRLHGRILEAVSEFECETGILVGKVTTSHSPVYDLTKKEESFDVRVNIEYEIWWR